MTTARKTKTLARRIPKGDSHRGEKSLCGLCRYSMTLLYQKEDFMTWEIVYCRQMMRLVNNPDELAKCSSFEQPWGPPEQKTE